MPGKTVKPRRSRRALDVPGSIDGHQHLLTEDGYAEKLLEANARLGIARAVVSGNGLFGMLDNRGVLKAAERYPDRLIPFLYVILGRDKPAMVRDAKRQGFRGIKLDLALFPYDDERAFPFYEQAEAQGLPALFHSGVITHVPGFLTSIEFMRPMRLDYVARRFRGMLIQIAHLGVPEYEISAGMARLLTNVFLDITGSPKGGWYNAKSPRFMRSLFYWKSWHEKLIFGTDAHYTLLEPAVRIHRRLLSAIRMTREMKANVYRDNARRFIGELPLGAYRPAGGAESLLIRRKPRVERS